MYQKSKPRPTSPISQCPSTESKIYEVPNTEKDFKIKNCVPQNANKMAVSTMHLRQLT